MSNPPFWFTYLTTMVSHDQWVAVHVDFRRESLVTDALLSE
jgi:hypothetical protein